MIQGNGINDGSAGHNVWRMTGSAGYRPMVVVLTRTDDVKRPTVVDAVGRMRACDKKMGDSYAGTLGRYDEQ